MSCCLCGVNRESHLPSLSPSLPPSPCCCHTHTHTHTHSQVMGTVLIFISTPLQTPLPANLLDRAQCQTKDSRKNFTLPCSESFYNNSTIHSSTITPQDFSHAMLFYLFLMAGIFIVLVLTFYPKYRRVDAEKKAKFEESVYIQSSH